LLPFEIITSHIPKDTDAWSRFREKHIGLTYPVPDQFADVCTEQQAERWWLDIWWVNYSVDVDNKIKAKELALKLHYLMEAADVAGATKVINELYAMRCPMAFERTPRQDWDYMLNQMPQDLGGSRFKEPLRDIFGNRYSGKILEAMCGFNSFFRDSECVEVVATDYSKPGLELYDFPNRRRILFDLDLISSSEDRLPFANDSEYDVVSICFGYKYLKNPQMALSAFRRAIKPGGKIVFVEMLGAGYTNLTLREFDSYKCAAALESAGFARVGINEDPCFNGLASPFGSDGFFMVEGS